MKLLRSVCVFLVVAVLVFGGRAEGSVYDTDAYAASGIGKVSGTTTEEASVYYFSSTSAMTVSVDISSTTTNDYSGDTEVTLLWKDGSTVISSVDVSGASITVSSITASDIPLTLTGLPSSSGTSKIYTCVISGDATSNTSEDLGTKLKLTFVPVTVTPFNTSNIMTFYVGSDDTQKLSLNATPTDASFDFKLNPIAIGSLPFTSTSKDISLKTTTLLPSAPGTWNVIVSADKIKIESDANNPSVAGVNSIIGSYLGTFVVKVLPRTLTLGSPAPNIYVTRNSTINTSFDAIVLPSTGVNAYTISDDISAVDSTTTRASWNGLTISSDYAAKKIIVSGIPGLVASHDFRVFAKSAINSTVVLASADFRINVTNYSLKLTPPVISVDFGAAFNDKTVATVSEDATKTFSLLTLSEGTRSNVASLDIWDGVTVSVDANMKDVQVKGTPETGSYGSKNITVRGTISGTGEVISNTLTLTIRPAPTSYSLTLKPASPLTDPVVDTNYSRNIEVSVTGTPAISLTGLLVDGKSNFDWNGLTIKVSPDYKAITVSGKPKAALTSSSWSVTGTASSTVSPTTLQIKVQPADSVVPRTLVSTKPGSWEGAIYPDNTFEMAALISLPSGTTPADIREIIATFAPGVVAAGYYIDIDYDEDGNLYIYIAGELLSGKTASDLVLRALQVIMTSGTTYEQTGILLNLQQIINAHKRSSSGGGGCDAGFGLAALALAGAALTWKRRTR